MFEKIKIKATKIAMNLLPNEPKFDLISPKNETIRHKIFLDLSPEEKREALVEISRTHFMSDQIHPFDHYYNHFGIDLERILNGTNVLDLGCSYGGKSVSWAERWSVKSMYGIDVNEYLIQAATEFAKERTKKNKYNFMLSNSENLPYDSNFFDAIVSFDVFEHVQSIENTLQECKRTLKSGGLLLSVFPTYYMPTEAHLNSVTKMPCLQWLFNAKTIQSAYDEIMESRGKSNYWYYKRGESGYDWAKLGGGIGINGTTIKEFEQSIKKIGFSKVMVLTPPLLSVGQFSIRNPKIKLVSKLIAPLNRIEMLKDYFTHRIVTYIKK